MSNFKLTYNTKFFVIWYFFLQLNVCKTKIGKIQFHYFLMLKMTVIYIFFFFYKFFSMSLRLFSNPNCPLFKIVLNLFCSWTHEIVGFSYTETVILLLKNPKSCLISHHFNNCACKYPVALCLKMNQEINVHECFGKLKKIVFKESP